MLLYCLFSVSERIRNACAGIFSDSILSYPAVIAGGISALHVSVFAERPHDVVSCECKKRTYGMIGVSLSAKVVKIDNKN